MRARKEGVIFEERKGGEREGRKGKMYRNITEQKHLSFTLKYLRKYNIYSSADKEILC